MTFRTENVPAHLSIRVEKCTRLLRPETERRISEIWDAEFAKRGPELFDGEILSFDGCTNGVIKVRSDRYRNGLAQSIDPRLFSETRVRPLSISGILYSGSRIGFGKRSARVTQDPGKWELVPSGGLTPSSVDDEGRVSWSRQFFQELGEETGFSERDVSSVEAVSLIEDPASKGVEIFVRARLRSDGSPGFSGPSEEYAETIWVESTEVPRFCGDRAKADGLVAVSREILMLEGWVARGGPLSLSGVSARRPR